MDNDQINKYENIIIKENELNNSEFNQIHANQKITDKKDSKNFNINTAINEIE